MDTSKFFPSKFLKADDIKTPTFATVSGVTTAVLGQGADAATKLVVQFREFQSGLVLNKTNFGVLVGLAGSQDSDAWIGLRVQLVIARVDFQGKRVPAIRIDPAGGTSAPAGADIGF